MSGSIGAAKAALSHLDIEQNPANIRTASRDFFWYSPVLKSRLDHIEADFVVRPRNEAEVIEILRTCYAHDVPVTARGAGTGNYAQAMPLAGGCVMHLKHLTEVTEIAPGRVVCQPGILLKDLDAACIAESGQEIRMFSSTWATATVGGFIAGGSGGVGSVQWGGLRNAGNIIRLRLVTMEAEPRVIELTGKDVMHGFHAYGTTGIITEIELPLAPAYDWTDVFVTTSDFEAAMDLGDKIANEDGVLIKLASIFEAPIAHAYFQRVKPHVHEGDHLLAFMIAPHAMSAFLALVAEVETARLIYRSDDHDWARGPGHVFEYGWNHTTLRALKFDPAITYLQVGYSGPDRFARVNDIRQKLYPEVLQHLEVARSGGETYLSGLSLVKFTTEERLEEIVQIHEDAGVPVYNPHRFTLEEGGRFALEPGMLAFRKMTDPKGLLNPGKMIEWDEPDWQYERMYSFSGTQPNPVAQQES